MRRWGLRLAISRGWSESTADLSPSIVWEYDLGVSNDTICRVHWWPFDTHSLYDDPQTGLFGGHA